MPEKLTLVATLDRHCTGELARYTFGTKRSTISGGFYIKRDAGLPREINVLVKQEEVVEALQDVRP